jgi:hypothetical protein
MTDQRLLTSSSVAEKAIKTFGNKVKPVDVKMKYRREVDTFLKKIETAHKRAEDSQLLFK